MAPFLKWAGGKRALLPALLPLVPPQIETYHEPFLGGGALFFALAAGARAGTVPFRRAVLTDANAELISCYLAIKTKVDAVLDALTLHRDGEDHFYSVREQDPRRLSDVERAARTIYLNRNGYNGLFRVNSSGRFNVPFGKYAKLRTVSPERLRAVAVALEGAVVREGDFEEALRGIGPRDFVYFDPPYVPLSATSSFTAYGAGGFSSESQDRLAALLRRLGDERVPALLSNSDCRQTRTLYRGLPLRAVQVARPINSVATRRGEVSELIVRSFAYSC